MPVVDQGAHDPIVGLQHAGDLSQGNPAGFGAADVQLDLVDIVVN
jgi:hypothetical protein